VLRRSAESTVNSGHLQCSIDVVEQLPGIAASEGTMPRVIGVHSIVVTDDSKQASIWFDLDTEANDGIVSVRVNAREIAGLDRHGIMQAIIGDDATRH